MTSGNCSARSNSTSKQRSGAENSGGHPWSPAGGTYISGFSPVVSELDLSGIGLPERALFKTVLVILWDHMILLPSNESS